MTAGGLGEQLRTGLARLNREAHADSFDRFDARTLCRASLVPRWNSDLAAGLGLVPAHRFDDLVSSLEAAGLVERGIDPDGGDRPDGPHEAFWVRARRRREIGDHVRERLGGAGVRQEYERLCDLIGGRWAGDDQLRRWLEVRDFRDDPSGKLLMDRVDALLDAGDLSGAAEIVATARLVGDVLGGTLEGAVKRAQWRLDREYRTTDDLDHLRGYFRRAGIEAAIHRLVAADDDQPWALHLMGDAGVGKTMVLRYLASGRLAEDFGLDPFPVARVDFDHLDPRYPEQRPVELLVALTDQLLGFAPSRAAEQYHRWVHDTADALHEELAKPDPDKQRARTLVTGAVERFARLVEELGGSVVLVLDTCEELAKLYAPGVSAPAIDRTFDLLEQLHDRVPRVRVVFAGRRWLVPPDSRAYGGPKLLPRQYVDVLRVAGFTAEEAVRFLDSREVPEGLRAALLERSAVRGTDRYNPFELESYCAWARSDPDLVAEDLLDAPGDPYVERRIVARIQDPAVFAALPVAVALGRFDRALITPTLRRMGVDPGSAFDGLAAQEWVTVVRLGPDGRPLVVEVDEHLRDRMRKVLASKEIGAPLDERRLGRDAAAVVSGSHRLSEVVAETVEAAMRLLPADEAAALWEDVERRVTERDDWGWAVQVTARVSVVEAERPSPGPTVLAAVLATQAAARLHTGQPQGLVELWTEVQRTAHRHPDPELREVLALRGELGRTAAGAPIDHDDWKVLAARARARPEVADSLLAAVEALCVDLPVLHDIAAALTDLTEHPAPTIAAAASILVDGVRLRLGFGQSKASRLALSRLEATREPAKHRDWVAPAGLLDRARLMRVLDALYGGAALDEAVWTSWRRDALQRRADDIDADRLVAATIDYELCHRVVPVAELPLDLQHHSWPATEWLHHRLARPLVMAVADALNAADEPEAAVELLAEHKEQAVASGTDARVVESCDLALLRLCRRHRRTDWAPVLRLAYEGSPRVRDEAWLVRRLVDDAEPDREPLSDYGYWRCVPDSTPPVTEWHPADHLDVWETESLAADSVTHDLLPDTPRARAVAALLAGDVRGLASPERGAALVQVAIDELRLAGDRPAADRAIVSLTAVATQGETVFQAGRDLTIHWDEVDSTNVSTITRQLFWARLADLTRIDILVLAAGIAVVLMAVMLVLFPQWWPVLVPAGAALSAGSVALRGLGDRQLTPVDVVRVAAKGRWITLETERSVLAAEMDGRRQRRLRVIANHRRWRPRDDYPLDPAAAPGAVAAISVPMRGVRREGTYHAIGLKVERGLRNGAWEQWLGRARNRYGTTPLVFRVHDGALPKSSVGATVFRGPWHLRPPRSHDIPELDLRLLHLVGTPVDTSAGTHFRVEAGSGTSSARAGDREILIDVERMATRPTRALVLQAEPVDSGPLPLDTTRADFIRCATAAVDAGVDTVLVVPPLTDRLAARVIARIWDTVGHPEASTRDVLLMLAELRSLVAEHEVSGRGPRPSLDLLLFHATFDHKETR
ncbi:MAG: ATP-binding protein [Saccharothrix sp.]|nr:ATP-binding protein [Saccharothrix sp.]